MNACLVRSVAKAAAIGPNGLCVCNIPTNSQGLAKIVGKHNCIGAYIVYGASHGPCREVEDTYANVSLRYVSLLQWCINRGSFMPSMRVYSQTPEYTVTAFSPDAMGICCAGASLRTVQWMYKNSCSVVPCDQCVGWGIDGYSNDPHVFSFLVKHARGETQKQLLLDTAIVHGNIENVRIVWDEDIESSPWTISLLCTYDRFDILAYMCRRRDVGTYLNFLTGVINRTTRTSFMCRWALRKRNEIFMVAHGYHRSE